MLVFCGAYERVRRVKSPYNKSAVGSVGMCHYWEHTGRIKQMKSGCLYVNNEDFLLSIVYLFKKNYYVNFESKFYLLKFY